VDKDGGRDFWSFQQNGGDLGTERKVRFQVMQVMLKTASGFLDAFLQIILVRMHACPIPNGLDTTRSKRAHAPSLMYNHTGLVIFSL
jgi:hypothetical protein